MQVLVTGATGRLGRLLRAAWADTSALEFQPVWSTRRHTARNDVAWDIASDPPPAIDEGFVILHLAGVLRGDAGALAANSALARSVCAAAKSAGAAHVFLASSAAVYGRSSVDHVEVHAPSPVSDYGRAKLAMERDALCWAHGAGQVGFGVTCLRIGNVLGADALLGATGTDDPVVLDLVPGQTKGPIRSYIGPKALAQVLAGLVAQVRLGVPLPRLLNIAAPTAVAMADLLDAAKRPYAFGHPNRDVIPIVSLSTKRLSALVPLLQSDAATMVADWKGLLATAA